MTVCQKVSAIIAVLWLALAAAPAAASEPPWSQLAAGPAATVKSVIDGDTLVLDDDSAVRLVGLQAPKLPLGRAHMKTWPLADEAKAALRRIALNRHARLYFGGRRADRHGRALAHLRIGDTWVQGALLRDGWARVYSFADNRKLIAAMLAAERQARQAGLGIWADPFYRVRTPLDAAGLIGSFQLVEGRVHDAARVRGRIYLNFGADYRTDFTVTIGPRDRRLFEAAGFDTLALKGREIRVRGWLKRYNGPMIEASHPEQIEVLAP